MNKRWFILGFVIIALLLRFLYLWQYSESPVFAVPCGPDVQEYDAWAREVVAGNWLWDEVRIHAPLYPWFLGCLYQLTAFDFYLIRGGQLVLNLLPAILIFLLMSHRGGGNTNTGRRCLISGGVFLVIYAVYLPLIYYQAEIVSEVLLLPLLVGALTCLYMAERKDRAAAADPAAEWHKRGLFASAGLLTGLAIICHPFALFFMAGECLYLAVSSCRFAGRRSRLFSLKYYWPLILFAGLAMSVLLPLSIYNTWLEKKPVLIQKNSGFNLFVGNNPDATGTCYLRPGPAWDRAHEQAAVASRQQKNSRDHYFIARTADFIKQSPLVWLGLLAKKAIYTFNSNELTAGADVWPLRLFTPLQRLFAWSSGCLIVGGLCGLFLVLMKRSQRYTYRHFLVLFFAGWAGQCLFVTSGRYRLPIILCLMVFAGAGAWLVYLRRRQPRTYLGLAGLLVVGSVVVWWPAPPVNSGQEQAEADTIYGEVYYKLGNYAKAEHYIQQSLSGLNNWSRSYNLLGMIYEKQKKIGQAEKAYRKAIELNPVLGYGYSNLGQLYLQQRRYQEADGMLQKAIELDPEDANVLFNYGYYLHQQCRLDDALKVYRKCLKIAPAYIRAVNNAAAILMVQQQYKQAAELFAKAAALEPENPYRYFNLAIALTACQQHDAARKNASRAVELHPELATHPELKKILK